jgi:hypothetical protein
MFVSAYVETRPIKSEEEGENMTRVSIFGRKFPSFHIKFIFGFSRACPVQCMCLEEGIEKFIFNFIMNPKSAAHD